MEGTIKNLYEAAASARENSHSPYSKYAVGAAVLTSDGEVYSGCNVENSSYGLTICAEQTAITKSVSEGHPKIAEFLVLTENSPPAPPCGNCRQTIAEFAGPEVLVHCANIKGEIITHKVKDILPHAFTPKHLFK